MAEFLLELYSEEIPANLQVSARNQIFKSLKDNLMIDNIKFEKYFVFSCPTRITIVIKDLPIKVKMPSKEIKGPKVGLNQSIIDNFMLTIVAQTNSGKYSNYYVGTSPAHAHFGR